MGFASKYEGLGELLSRLRWGEDVPGRGTVEDKAVIARTFATLFGLGGIVALVTLLLPGDPQRFEIGIAFAALLAIGVSVVMVVGYDRLPMWVFAAAPPLGTVLATGVVLSGGDEVVTVYAFYYFWVVLAAFSFLSLRAGLLNVVWVAVAYGAALQWLGSSYPALRWLMAAAALTVAGLLIMALRDRVSGLVGSLRVQVREQDAVAELGRRALATADTAELFTGTARTVAETLGVERAAVLGLPEGKTLMFRGGVGWDLDAVRSAPVPLDDPLAGAALLARGPVIYDEAIEPLVALDSRGSGHGKRFRGIAAAIRGGDDVLGVLVAYGTPRRRFTDSDARFVQSAANVLAEAERRREVEDNARRQLLYDPVTDRPNRTLFMDRLGEALIRAERDSRTLGVFVVEIEDFKLLNDAYGDLFGNALLRSFASRLRRPLFLADTVARLGGPEFAVLCEGLESELEAAGIAGEMLAAIHEPFEIAGEPIRVTASIGIAVSEPGLGTKDLLVRADAALLTARGSDTESAVFDSELESRLRHRVWLGHALSEAGERGELSLAHQPIVSLGDGSPVATECLLRWSHPERGDVEPSEFIPVAEQTGAIISIGSWAIDEAVRSAAAIRRSGGVSALPLHVNVSPRQLAHADFAPDLAAALAAHEVPGADIALEITEAAFLRDAELAERVLEEVHEMGVRLVLDDFGTGYSALSHLNRFPLDAIKVDRCLVSSVDEDAANASIVAAVVRMGLALGLEVIAVGVETPAQAKRLKALGCRVGQGVLYAVPVAPGGTVDPEAAARASSRLA